MVVGASSSESQVGCTLAAYYHRQRSRQQEVMATDTKKYCVEGEIGAEGYCGLFNISCCYGNHALQLLISL